ncbi:MAG: thioredoxin fold domain-containing protein [Fervidobacterium sp.]|nr:thioredoxin fold domain-containing protein [Fervidobacterium sp.]NPU88795.1 thioredoxin fold domain-containing protein [Fervidobacterium sp.]
MARTLRILLLSALIFSTLLFGALNYQYVFKDLGLAHKLSVVEGKTLLIYFGSAGCGWCKKLENEVLNDPAVQEFLRANFVLARILGGTSKTVFMGKEYTNNELFKLFSVKGTPTCVFMKGENIVYTEVGYSPVNEYLKILKSRIRIIDEGFDENSENLAKDLDKYCGKPMIITISKEDAEFVLENDKNAKLIEKLPEDKNEIDTNTTYVTASEEIAKELNAIGVIRVLLIQDKNE